jgi:hypothetical protein
MAGYLASDGLAVSVNGHAAPLPCNDAPELVLIHA